MTYYTTMTTQHYDVPNVHYKRARRRLRRKRSVVITIIYVYKRLCYKRVICLPRAQDEFQKSEEFRKTEGRRGP